MKSTITRPPAHDLDQWSFPVLLETKTMSPPLIVLATSWSDVAPASGLFTGTVVSEENLGLFSPCWRTEDFQPFLGEIKLSNDLP